MRRLAPAFALLVAVVAAPDAGASGKKNHSARTHTVRAGDTLWDIAQAIGCRVDDVRHANAMGPGSPLRIGTELSLPRCDGDDRSARVHVVESGDTLSEIAAKYGTTVQAIQRANGLDSTVIVRGQRLTVGTLEPTLPLRVIVGQSVGRPQHGKLVDGVRLPHDSAYYRRRVERAYAAQHVIDHTRRVIASVRRTYPNLHRLAIGDLSAKKGGSISGHHSHQSGRDIDLGLYFEKAPDGYPQEFVRADAGELHHGATWTLVRALWEASKQPGGPKKVFLDYRVQGELYEYAKKRGVPTKQLHQIFQYPNGRWAKKRFVQHEPLHADHLHVRFACPKGDDTCK